MTMPFYQILLFSSITLLTIFLLNKAHRKSNAAFWTMAVLAGIQLIPGLQGYYLDIDELPPRFIRLIAPWMVVMILIFISAPGKKFINKLDMRFLTLLHIVRIPVEVGLYFLFVDGFVPEIMTFSGRNFDILAGLTAPFIYYYGFVKTKLKTKGILIWNVVALLLLLNIVFTAIFSAPYPFQKFGFDQPNIGVLYFPVLYLPALIVPAVLFAHLASIKLLFQSLKEERENSVGS
ncbi:MAG: hypothetical protein H6605_09945 [Flavobacteriales bacterium]|nr:hypothetical protein [Flavobacteriales bacterium]